jgi:iron uptake system EfeUOB component EfeO/EfeM
MRLFTLMLDVLRNHHVGLAACSHKTEAPKSVSPFKPSASLQELMVSVIDPNVDPIWNAVSTVSTKEGTEEKQPQSDDEWKALRNHAIMHIEVSNLLVIEVPC